MFDIGSTSHHDVMIVCVCVPQDEDDADLTEAFKASIGLLGEEGVGGVTEIEWAMDEERDQTISR